MDGIDNREENPIIGGMESMLHEAYVFGKGTEEGFLDALHDASHHKLATGLKFLGAAFANAGLAYLSRGQGILAPGLAKTIALSMGASFLFDLTRKDRLDAIGAAWSASWNSRTTNDADVALIRHSLGKFAFDTALMTAGGCTAGLLTGHLGGHLFNQPRPDSSLPTVRSNWLTGTRTSFFADGSTEVYARKFLPDLLSTHPGFESHTYSREGDLLTYRFKNDLGQTVIQSYPSEEVDPMDDEADDEGFPSSTESTAPDISWKAIQPDGTIITPDTPGPWTVRLRDWGLPSEVERRSDEKIIERWRQRHTGMDIETPSTHPGSRSLHAALLTGRSWTNDALPSPGTS